MIILSKKVKTLEDAKCEFVNTGISVFNPDYNYFDMDSINSYSDFMQQAIDLYAKKYIDPESMYFNPSTAYSLYLNKSGFSMNFPNAFGFGIDVL